MSKILAHRTINPISVSILLAVIFASMGLIIAPIVTLINPLNLYYISKMRIKRW